MQSTEADSEVLAVPVKPKPSATALIPFLVFIGLILVTAIVMTAMGEAKPFGHLPAAVALFFAVVVAFLIYRGSLAEKFETFVQGAGHNNIVIMVLTVLLAGGFASVASASGGVESFVNLTLTLVPATFLVPGIFLAAGIMSLATGSSTGTTAAMGPIALSVAQAADLNLAMVFAAVLSGAFVGDGLSFVSDTTIVVTRGQGVKMKDKFRLNWKIAFPSMLVTLGLFVAFGSADQAASPETGDFNLVKVLPYFLVLITAIIGINVFVVLTVGILASGIVGMAFGELNFSSFNEAIFEGFEGMIGIIVLAVFIGGLSEMMSRAGGLEFIVVRIQKLIRGRKSAEIGIAAIVGLVDVAIANNTAALIATNDVCKQIARQYKVDPRRTASLMDIFCCVGQGLIPYGNQILLLVGIGGALVSPVEVIPFMWYPMVLGALAILSIFIPFADGAVRKDPWNWEKNTTESDVRKHATTAL
ncbi:Na+/H+ antiporter NhaC family protein [Paenarthrobacter sp. NCHU4564]|uniref:Na+/H+ antiporter NhaC family protein n=1 Tax=Paenarthrobacter sp. NCHU4564 TaxID=3451353 RepID=UPI003F94E8EE